MNKVYIQVTEVCRALTVQAPSSLYCQFQLATHKNTLSQI